MNLNFSPYEKKATFADLKAEYLYIFLPFIVLIFVKVYTATWQEIILSPEWALATCIIFGQTTFKISKAIAYYKTKTNDRSFGWYTAKRFSFVFIAMTVYFGMLFKPTIELGWCQIVIFIFASIFHFKDGFTAALLQKNSNKR